jgi:hypothetical protein
MDNLTIYNSVRAVPKEALKEIQAGRLKGKSDINPMWRLKTLTEQFGPCGIGWKFVITRQWLENGANEEISAFVNIDLFIKADGVWSDAIPGTGGSAFVAKESKGLYVSDECFKMALTDAIGVSCKALGLAADVYWNGDRSKYDKPALQTQQGSQGKSGNATPPTVARPINNIQKAKIQDLAKAVGKVGADITALCKTTYKKQFSQLTETEAGEIIATLQIELDKKTAELEPPSTPLPEPQREDLFSGAKMPEKAMKAIHARAAEIGMAHEELRSYAQCQYPIKSLKDLNEEQGKALLADLRALPAMDQAGDRS